MQSALVPICSSPGASCAYPPSPTQNAEYVVPRVVQVTLGSTHSAYTLVNCVDAPVVAFVPVTA